MVPRSIDKARASTLTKPVVRSASARRKLAQSLRRLGADSQTVTQLTGPRRVRTAGH